MTTDETAILHALDAAIRHSPVAKALARVADELEGTLHAEAATRLAWRALSLGLYPSLPPTVASSWVFALRSDCTSGAERHPNSIQRFMSYRGAGDMQIWSDGRWVSHRLTSDAAAPLAERWLSIPRNVWHKPVMGEGDWIVVSFHTVPAAELIEERPASDDRPDESTTTAELYAGRNAR
jgi:hypothetical protein